MSYEVLSSFKDVLLDKKAFAHLAIVRKDGRPHVSPVWFDTNEEDLKTLTIHINSETNRVKSRIIKEKTEVSLSIVDPDNPYRFLGINGTVIEIVKGQTAVDHINNLSFKYLGEKTYPYLNDKEERVSYKIKIDSVSHSS